MQYIINNNNKNKPTIKQKTSQHGANGEYSLHKEKDVKSTLTVPVVSESERSS